MSTTAKSLAAPTLADIAAAQAADFAPASDRAHPARRLAGLQNLYAHRMAQLTTLEHMFQGAAPELTLRGELHQLILSGELVNGIYQELTHKLDNALKELEVQIVGAHQQVAQWAEDVATDFANKVDYVPHILALCQPTSPMAAALPGAPVLTSQARQAA